MEWDREVRIEYDRKGEYGSRVAGDGVQEKMEEEILIELMRWKSRMQKVWSSSERKRGKRRRQ